MTKDGGEERGKIKRLAKRKRRKALYMELGDLPGVKDEERRQRSRRIGVETLSTSYSKTGGLRRTPHLSKGLIQAKDGKLRPSSGKLE